MVLESKAVLGFNLSFFADQHDMIDAYMNQILAWLTESKVPVLSCPAPLTLPIDLANRLCQMTSPIGYCIILNLRCGWRM